MNKKFSLHAKISFIKSLFRIIGFGLMFGSSWSIGLVALIFAEIIGILEELYE